MENRPLLQKSNTKFHTYTGYKLNVFETGVVKTDYQGQHYKVTRNSSRGQKS